MSHQTSIDWRVPEAQAWQGSEDSLQGEIITRSMALAGRYPEILLLHAIPNGGWRGWREGKKLKAQGVIPGIPDLCMPVARGGYHGFYLELKKAGGHVSSAQWEILEALEIQGYFVRVANHLGVALEIIENYLLEMP